MAETLPRFVPVFAGSIRLIRCFLHVLNLVVKSILKRFEDSAPSTDKDLADLLRDVESEESDDMVGDDEGDDEDDEEPVVDALSDDWADVVDDMTECERDELEEQVQPARRVILKVCFDPNYIIKLTSPSAAHQNFLCCQTLNYSPPASMARHFSTARTLCTLNTSTDEDPLERNICHARVRDWRIPTSYRSIDI